MKRLLLLIFLFSIFFVPQKIFAAGTVTVSIENIDAMVQGVKKGQTIITVDCTATAGGAVSGDLASIYAATSSSNPQIDKIFGKIKSIETIPGASGDKSTNTPSPGYDLTFTDPYGYDVTCGNLVDRSESTAEMIVPVSDIIVNSELTITGTNCGNGGQFRVIISLEQ